MKEKIIGIFVCVLLIATLAIPISAMIKEDKLEIFPSKYFYLGAALRIKMRYEEPDQGV